MGILNRIFGKLFGRKKETSTPSGWTVSVEDQKKWQQEREEQQKALEFNARIWILKKLKEKPAITFTWESGGDEAFVYFDEKMEMGSPEWETMDLYIVDKLEIPDAGEFQMKGEGTIYQEANSVKVKYSSNTKEIVDYNEEKDEVVYGEDDFEESGDKVLFVI